MLNKKNSWDFGTSDCNIVAALIIKELETLFPEVKAQIYVTWVERFFVINGYTDYINSFDISKIINEYYEMNSDDWTPVNVVDLINYGKEYSDDYHYSHFDLGSFLFEYYEPDRPVMIEDIYAHSPVTSHRFFGCSLSKGKTKTLMKAKIAYHILSSNFTNQVYVDIEDDNEIYISSKSWLVKESHAKNVVDACFGGKIEEEIKNMDLHNFDFIKLINGDGGYPWMVRDHIKDFMMI